MVINKIVDQHSMFASRTGIEESTSEFGGWRNERNEDTSEVLTEAEVQVKVVNMEEGSVKGAGTRKLTEG